MVSVGKDVTVLKRNLKPIPTAMSRSKGEVHDRVPTSSSSPAALFESCLFVGTDVVVKDTMRTDGCLKRVST